MQQPVANKKYSTDYWRWSIWLIGQLSIVAALSFMVYKGTAYEKKYVMDLTGYLIVAVAIAGLGLLGWEIVTLFDYLLKGTTGDIYLSDYDLTISTKNGRETFRFSDLKEIEFVSPRFGSRSVTNHISHCKLVFSNRTIFLTSFTIENEDLANILRIKGIVRTRERRYFELMR